MPMMGGSAAYQGPQSWSDRVALIGAALKDASPGSSGDSLLNTQNMLAGRQMYALQRAGMSQMMGLFGGQAQDQAGGVNPAAADPAQSSASTVDSGMPGGSAPAVPQIQQHAAAGPSLSDPLTQRTLLGAAMFGVPGAKEAIEMLDKGRPTVKFTSDGQAYDERSPSALSMHSANRTAVNGQVLDLNDAKNTNLMVPTAPVPGAMPIYDNLGHVVDWKMPGGAVSAIGAAAAAKTGAEEAAKLPFVGPGAYATARGQARGALQTVPLPGGGTMMMPGDQYIDGGGPGGAQGAPAGPHGPIPQVGAPPAAAGPARPGLGTSQTPADAEYQKGLAADAAGRFKGLQAAGAAAPSAIARLQAIRGLLKGYEGGKYAPELVGMAGAANQFGFKLDPQLANKQVAQAMQAQMTMELMKNPDTGGNMFPRVTNFEMQQFTRAVPGLMQSAGGRDKLIDMYSAVQQRASDIAQNAYQWNQKYGRIDAPDASGKSFQDRLDAWSAKHPLFAGIKGAGPAK